MYVLDTNTLIYFFKGLGNVSVQMLSKAPAEIAIPAIVLYEIEVGIGKSGASQKRKEQLRELAGLTTILDFGRKEAEIAATVRLDLEKEGMLIGPYDILIAATTIASNGILITRNKKEFERIESLKIQDWY